MRPGRFHPGNGGGERLPAALEKSFNEAGAFPPRKLPAVDRVLFLLNCASMRPGRFHPGNAAITKNRSTLG